VQTGAQFADTNQYDFTKAEPLQWVHFKKLEATVKLASVGHAVYFSAWEGRGANVWMHD